jgi:hypothetical protein
VMSDLAASSELNREGAQACSAQGHSGCRVSDPSTSSVSKSIAVNCKSRCPDPAASPWV